MKPWQKGYDLAELRRVAAIFREGNARFCHGAFGLLKERDVATAMQLGRLYQVEGGAMVMRAVKGITTHHDFAGRDLKLWPGDLFCSDFAAVYDAARDLLLKNLSALGGRRVWLEIFEEDEPLKRAAQAAGFRWVMTKITAASDLKGLYCRGPETYIPPLREEDRCTLVCLGACMLSASERVAIRKELAGTTLWQQHYSSYNKRRSWTAFSLRGFKPDDPRFIIKPAEMSKAWKEENHALLGRVCEDTVVAREFPVTMKFVNVAIPGQKERVRFMRLAPGGELTRHADITDRDAGFLPGKVARLHVPIETDPACLFTTWGERGQKRETHMAERGLYYLDTRKPHAVKNAGTQDRIHLVIDTLGSEALAKWL